MEGKLGLYKKKPIVVEAIEWTGYNTDEILVFGAGVISLRDNAVPVVETLEGDMVCSIGDYVIKGVNGEFYPCKSDIFKKTYDKVEQNIIQEIVSGAYFLQKVRGIFN